MTTASQKAYMAQAAGINYDVLTDEYVMPDDRRISARDTMQGSIGYEQHYSNNTKTNGWQQSLNMGSLSGSKELEEKLHKDVRKDVLKEIVEKIKTKYEGRDLLMIKTADLIREIEKL